jgi:replicative DNA helicase
MSDASPQVRHNSAQDAGTAPGAPEDRRYGRSAVSAFAESPPSPPSIGAAPPHSLEAEQSVLGAIFLSDRTLYALVIDEGLKAEDFYRERHRTIYESILELYADNEPVDHLTVAEHLQARGKLEDVGGRAAVEALAGAVPAAGNARQYARIVRQQALLRRLLTKAYEIQAGVLNNSAPAHELVEQAERAMFEVAHDDRTKDFRNVGDVLHEEIDKWQKLADGGLSITGTPSGFADLDEITGGFQPGNLIVIGARPSMGKCQPGWTLVHDPMTGARRRLDELVAAHERGDDVWVTALGPDLRFRPAKVSATFRNGSRALFRVRTRLGRCTEATANHPLLTIEGWKRVDELSVGHRVAVPRRLPRCGRPTVLRDHELVLLADGSLAGAPVVGKQVKAAAALAGLASRGDGTNVDTIPPDERLATGVSSNELAEPATSDIWWDEIVSIEPIGEAQTYDITVPLHHNFVADDVVVHNSAMVANIAENVALDKHNPRAVALFSLEMSEAELAQRFVASQASIKGDDLRKGRLKEERKWKRVLDVAEHFARAPLYIDDSSDIGILEIRAKARRLHSQEQHRGGLGLIIVDYLQLMRPDSRVESRVEQVGQMSRGLKILARELHVPVIALSQLNRGVESRPNKRPLLSDLRDSGNVEQDSDLVMFIYRDEYYNEETENPGEAELHIAKHRNGSLGVVSLSFQGEYPRFLGIRRDL